MVQTAQNASNMYHHQSTHCRGDVDNIWTLPDHSKTLKKLNPTMSSPYIHEDIAQCTGPQFQWSSTLMEQHSPFIYIYIDVSHQGCTCFNYHPTSSWRTDTIKQQVLYISHNINAFFSSLKDTTQHQAVFKEAPRTFIRSSSTIHNFNDGIHMGDARKLFHRFHLSSIDFFHWFLPSIIF